MRKRKTPERVRISAERGQQILILLAIRPMTSPELLVELRKSEPDISAATLKYAIASVRDELEIIRWIPRTSKEGRGRCWALYGLKVKPVQIEADDVEDILPLRRSGAQVTIDRDQLVKAFYGDTNARLS